VQFSNGSSDHAFIECAEGLKRFLHNRRETLNEIFGFNMLCDLGAIKEWLPSGSVNVAVSRGKLVGKIRYASTRVKAYDCMPLLKNFGFRRLSDVGEVVGVGKLDKPIFLGLRKWESPEEYESFKQYALADAIITAKAAKWLIEDNGCDPRVHASAGSIAAEFFDFPERNRRVHGRIAMSPIERMIAQSTFAGRSEMFRTGYMAYAVYNDVKSLYPLSIFATRGLCIDSVQPCDPKELALSSDLNDARFGWLVGCFES